MNPMIPTAYIHNGCEVIVGLEGAEVTLDETELLVNERVRLLMTHTLPEGSLWPFDAEKEVMSHILLCATVAGDIPMTNWCSIMEADLFKSRGERYDCVIPYALTDIVVIHNTDVSLNHEKAHARHHQHNAATLKWISVAFDDLPDLLGGKECSFGHNDCSLSAQSLIAGRWIVPATRVIEVVQQQIQRMVVQRCAYLALSFGPSGDDRFQQLRRELRDWWKQTVRKAPTSKTHPRRVQWDESAGQEAITVNARGQLVWDTLQREGYHQGLSMHSPPCIGRILACFHRRHPEHDDRQTLSRFLLLLGVGVEAAAQIYETLFVQTQQRGDVGLRGMQLKFSSDYGSKLVTRMAKQMKNDSKLSCKALQKFSTRVPEKQLCPFVDIEDCAQVCAHTFAQERNGWWPCRDRAKGIYYPTQFFHSSLYAASHASRDERPRIAGEIGAPRGDGRH